MTALEWFANQLGITSGTMLEQAKEMEKQQIIDAFDEGQKYEYQYQELWELSEHINWDKINKQEGFEAWYRKALETFSKTEISDEEIESNAVLKYKGDNITQQRNNTDKILAFEQGAKWYREQLKQG